MRHHRIFAVALAATLAVAACSSDGDERGVEADGATADEAGAEVTPLRGPSTPTEHVGLTTQIPIDRASFDETASALFGEEAAAGS